MGDLLYQLYNKHPDFEENLTVFSDDVKQLLFEKLTNEKDITNFTSTLAEIDFGLLFNKLGLNLEYDKLYNKQTPDWTISIGDSKAICEVYKYSNSYIKQPISDYEFRLLNVKLEKIIQYEWLTKTNNLNEKISKYNEIISQTKYPYFIAIALDFASGFEFDNFKEYFLGSGFEFDCDKDADYETLKEDSDYGSEWTKLGIFYQNPQLSGIIVLDNRKFHVLLNPLKNQEIYNASNEALLKLVCNINNM
jgi:hypothetical protein